jgi:hypothetical protein
VWITGLRASYGDEVRRAMGAARKVSHGWSFGISDLEGGTEGLSMILKGLA